MTTEHNTETPRILEPCEHMENWVNGLADNSLKGPARLYTQFHIKTCSKCRTAFIGLQDVHARLHELKETLPAASSAAPALTPERREALEGSMNLVEQQKPGPAAS